MSVVYDTSLKNTRMTDVRDAINGGTIEICTAAYGTVLAICALSNPSGTVANGVLTFSAIAEEDAALGDGTAAIARIKDSGGNIKVTGLTVGTSGANINLNAVAIVTGDIVRVTAGTITHG